MFGAILGGLSGLGGEDGDGGILGSFGSFSDGDSILGSINDLWGSISGTPADVFLNAGKLKVKELSEAFDQTFAVSPSEAFNAFEYGLKKAAAKFDAALRNSSQTKTKVGNTQSLKDVKAALSQFSAMINQENGYTFKVLNTKSGSETVGSKSKSYTYKVYDVTKKTEKQEAKSGVSDIINKAGFDTNTVLMAAGALLIFIFRKKIF